MVQLSSSFVLIAAFAVVAPSFAAPSEDGGYYSRRSLYEDEVDEVSMRELEEILSRAPQPWIAAAGKILNGLGTAGTVASIGSAIGGMFKKKNKKRSLWDEEELDARAFEDELDERDMHELVEILSRAPEPWIGAAGKILNGLGTAGTVASIGSAIGGMFKSKKNKKREFFDDEELYMRMFVELSQELASLERRYGSSSLDELD
ncbi:hypothetical protein BKA70DRAFT_1399683 [Coprinopsis sp. MPI-PUGE-AT-0042]|nr:hypothetical protein BKA70DRAFT_1399683 [Coprinopsis sp. MPI-PUGE-AT-0042]